MALDVGKTEAASKASQKLLHEMSELKESLRLERSRNADTDRKCGSVCDGKWGRVPHQLPDTIRERGSVLYLGMALECWDFAKLAIA